MASDEARFREYLIARAVHSIPRPFVVEVHDRFVRAYPEEFAEAAHRAARIDEQRIFNLAQDRCFRMDWELFEAAKAHGLVATAKGLVANKWHHTYVVAGAFGLTQSYVQRPGDLPPPARFRDALAEAAKCPRLPLDDPEEIYRAQDFYALFVHNPIGRSFSEEHQKLGSLMLSVPNRDMRGWALEISVPELISYYPVEKKDSGAGRGPAWKPRQDRETGNQ